LLDVVVTSIEKTRLRLGWEVGAWYGFSDQEWLKMSWEVDECEPLIGGLSLFDFILAAKMDQAGAYTRSR
jgi:hypothetical protein